MAKVHPQLASSSSPPPPPSPYASRRETFTIWMKSLVLHGNGCTAFDAKGDVVYRIDNYNKKGGNQVYLMDLRGEVLFVIHRKKPGVLGCWEGYRSNGSEESMEKPCFKVRKVCRILNAKATYRVTVGCDRAQPDYYKIEGGLRTDKSAYKIVDELGGVVAEVKRKQSSSGVVLGGDVFTLMVEPHVDHSLIMGIVVVYGLINHKL
ncbi:PREDICTED: protein LURP-one-related 11 [Nelumbo nucifera]|uniref:Protein LURP-one-related 11 n=2 Tax=Nelumbo nucifera TaxID=4432 RepID=A0A822ZQB1_NELNU|nr:PREDICTED: protein LURP-one-related 11 [Nelumbo nucifera]DAD47422.1 TPA_asm: hypothetical protein HUJ06_017359 [Nelumbo nucifera]